MKNFLKSSILVFAIVFGLQTTSEARILTNSCAGFRSAARNEMYTSGFLPAGNKTSYETGVRFLYVASGGERVFGLRCESLKGLKEVVRLINLALLPVALAFRNPMVSAALADGLAAAGITVASASVLTATVIGGSGIAVIYIIVDQSIEQCERYERESFKQEILREVKDMYGIQSTGKEPLEIRKR